MPNHQLETLYYHPTKRAEQKRALLNLPRRTEESERTKFTQNIGDASKRWNISTMAKYGTAGGAVDAQTIKWFQDLQGQRQLTGYVNMPYIHTSQLVNTPANRGTNEFAGTGGAIRNSVSKAGPILPYPKVSEEMGQYGDTQIGLYPFNLSLKANDPLSINFAHSLYMPNSNLGLQNHMDKMIEKYPKMIDNVAQSALTNDIFKENLAKAGEHYSSMNGGLATVVPRAFSATGIDVRDPTEAQRRAVEHGEFNPHQDEDDWDEENGGNPLIGPRRYNILHTPAIGTPGTADAYRNMTEYLSNVDNDLGNWGEHVYNGGDIVIDNILHTSMPGNAASASLPRRDFEVLPQSNGKLPGSMSNQQITLSEVGTRYSNTANKRSGGPKRTQYELSVLDYRNQNDISENYGDALTNPGERFQREGIDPDLHRGRSGSSVGSSKRTLSTAEFDADDTITRLSGGNPPVRGYDSRYSLNGVPMGSQVLQGKHIKFKTPPKVGAAPDRSKFSPMLNKTRLGTKRKQVQRDANGLPPVPPLSPGFSPKGKMITTVKS